MTDKEKKETLCIFITPSERLGVDENGKNFYRCCGGNEKKYFEKFYNHAVLPLEYASYQIGNYGLGAIQDENVKNIQVIFDIHGSEEGLSISWDKMHQILDPILSFLGDKKLEILMANCQGNLKFNDDGLVDSLPDDLGNMAVNYDINPENISLYCMPEGHKAYIGFNNNGDIFFVSGDASFIRSKYENNTKIDSFYKKEHQKEDEPDTRITFNKNYVETQAEKPFDEKGNKQQPVLQGVYKGRPPMKIDISTGEQLPTGLVLYKEPLASKIKNEPDLNLNKENEINTTIKK